MQTPGLPDLFVFLPLRDGLKIGFLDWTPCWIEVKARSGKLRPAQVEFQSLAVDSGVMHIVGWTDTVIDALRIGGWLK